MYYDVNRSVAVALSATLEMRVNPQPGKTTPFTEPIFFRTDQLQQLSGGWIVVKLGARGCLGVGPGGVELEIPAPAVEIADTTGAGDAFNAGLVHALSDGVEWPEALAVATRFASEIIARPSDERYRVAVIDDISSE